MRFTKKSAVLLLVFLGVCAFIGCGDNGTAPGDKNEHPSEELTHSWSGRFGDAAEQTGHDVVVDASGNTIVTGNFWGTVDFGGGDLTSAGATDIFVAKFGPDGTHIWSEGFGNSTEQEVASVTVDASGNVIITGNFYGAVDFGGGTLTSAGSNDIFVAKFAPDGAHLWSKGFGSTGPQSGRGVSTDASGNVIVAGRFAGTLDFGGGTLTSGGSDDVFVAKFTPDGTHLWSKRFGDASAQYATDVTVDGSGNVTITGYLDGSIDFGGGTLTGAGSIDIFVAKFDPTGAHLWSKRFGDSDEQNALSIAHDASGNLIIAGYFDGSVDFGGGALTSAGNYDIYVAKFDPAGTHVWSKRFGDASYQETFCVAADASGKVILAGNFDGTVECGGDALTSAGSYDVFIAKFSATGAHLWSDSYGDASSQYVLGVAAGSSGVVAITGELHGTVDFGGGDLTSAGAEDVFVARFAP
jgi:hypothetical protein